jgi:hypothetical protein
MRKVLLALLLLSSVAASAQKKKKLNSENHDSKFLHLGFSLSINSMNFRVEPSAAMLTTNDTIYGVESESQLGFGLGLISDIRLNNYFNLRFQPGLQLGQRNLIYKVRQYPAASGEYRFVTHADTTTMKIPSIYVDFPLLVKFRAKRINNYRPYFIGGVSVKWDYEARRENTKNVLPPNRVKPLQYYYELGFGIDSYMPFFKLSTEVKFCQGLNDILQHDDNAERAKAIDRLMAKMIVVSLHFE